MDYAGLNRTVHTMTTTTLPVAIQPIISNSKSQSQIAQWEWALICTITHLYTIPIDYYKKRNRNSINPMCKYTITATCLLATTQVQQYKTALLNVTLSSSGCWKAQFKATLLFVGSNVNWSCEIYWNSRRYYRQREAIYKKLGWIFNFFGKWSNKKLSLSSWNNTREVCLSLTLNVAFVNRKCIISRQTREGKSSQKSRKSHN